MSARPEVVEVTDASELVEAAGRRFVETVVAAQRERGSASVVLTGGSNGIALLEWLRDNGSDIDWRSVDIWFGDDRFVPEADDERNSGQARDALLAHVDVDPDRVFVMAPSDGAFGDDIDAAAADYARLLAEDATLHELEVERAGLTDAFLRLSDNASSSPQQHKEAA